MWKNYNQLLSEKKEHPFKLLWFPDSVEYNNTELAIYHNKGDKYYVHMYLPYYTEYS